MSIGLTHSVRSADGVAAPRVEPAPSALHEAVAIVIPCFNEQEALPHLFERLAALEAALVDHANVHFCFVDDGSTDGTWTALCEHVEPKPNRTVVRHETNRGLSAAILTGIANTDAPIVCSIDADCTYDPTQIPAMLQRMTEGVAAVTASPYHPDGGVSGVAAWRLWLSKLASTCYRILSQNKLHTYTSCFRAYRREALIGIEVRHRGFAGVAEMLWRVDRRGGKIVEHPTVLRCRQAGQSKLRVVPVMREHMKLLARCAYERLFFQSRDPQTARAGNNQIRQAVNGAGLDVPLATADRSER